MEPNELLTLLSQLKSKEKCLAFAAGCCERLMPVFVAFCKHENCPADYVSECKELLWSLALAPDTVSQNLTETIERLEALTPDPDRSDYFLVNCAANAVTAVQASLQYSTTEDLDSIVQVSQLAISTIDEYIGRVDYPQSKVFVETSWFDPWIETHPLLTEEVERQQQDLELLRSCDAMSQDVMRRIRKESGRCGVQPLRRKLL